MGFTDPSTSELGNVNNQGLSVYVGVQVKLSSFYTLISLEPLEFFGM